MARAQADDETQRRLNGLREALLLHHKTLLESERGAYERSVERITSTNQYLELVLHDPWFGWLHELSQFIVLIDTLEEAEEPPSKGDADNLVAQTRLLLTPRELGHGFEKHYFEALQRDPDVVIAHGKTMRILASLA